MKVNVRADKMEVTNSIKKYVEEKISKLDKYFKNEKDLEASIRVKEKGNKLSVEVTIPTKNFVLRREESDKDLYAAIDLVADKLERQIRKNKTRIERKVKEEFVWVPEVEEEQPVSEKIVKRKNIPAKLMDEEEAILELELLGHDFFVFKNVDEDCMSILYKRKESNYGIINIK